jgi:glycosyltransferase involved in cell wall biosynthesis
LLLENGCLRILGTATPRKRAMRICFLAMRGHGILGVSSAEIAGGAETQQFLLASELARRGHEVSFVTLAERDTITRDGIKVFAARERRQGMRGVRFVYPRVYSIFSALLRADADIYIHRTAGADAGLLAIYCMVAGKPMIFSVASDYDCSRRTLLVHQRLDVLLNEFAVRWASEIVIQKEEQRERLLASFGRNGRLIRSGCILPEHQPPKPPRPMVLWVGTVKPIKQPEAFLQLAEELPDHDFILAGGSSCDSSSTYENILARASTLKNLSMPGFVPFTKMHELYEKAWVLINTSPSEGFSNTFLEAWSRRTPVISFVDPDEVICRQKLGVHVSSFAEMVEATKKLLTERALSEELGRNAHEYVAREHSIGKVVEDYEELFRAKMREYGLRED